MKWIVYVAVMLSILPAFAQFDPGDGRQQHRNGRRHSGGGGHREFTDEQKDCLSGILGEPGQGERPSREAMESAFQECNISANQNGNQNSHPPGPRPNLTEEQFSCLEGKLGKPGEGERPTEETFKQAHTECGIELPERATENQ